MFRTRAFRSRAFAGGLVAAILWLTVPMPAAAQTQAPAAGRQGTLQGTVYSEGMKAKVANAIVKIRNLNNQKEYVSAPTDASTSSSRRPFSALPDCCAAAGPHRRTETNKETAETVRKR